MSGSSRSLPTGRRASAMMLALEASRMNFIQSSVRIAGLATPSMPALPHSAAKASARALLLPSSSPNTMRITVPVWRITPGSAMVALMLATPPITACWPRMGARRSAASTPFCSGITAVSLPTIGLIAAPALSTSHNFTQNSTTSTAPTVFGSSVACVGTRCVSPRGLSTFSPVLFMAARCAPRAMKVTSAPALARAAPKAPPTPPAPTTAIRMSRSPIRSGRRCRSQRSHPHPRS